ncbi:hypothetical protein MES5069_1270016 [Mesorhizobium escarrei]|uniref:Propionyl-coenzyme A carboxylase alpha polypeptide n=1 Tax=Mesorhizobium escarrei TaxID=666018 RepID=A0ABM9DH60_9HYPH|nr:hypothetical protein MES5069_1270016 [Mesorhizobium escarrei]
MAGQDQDAERLRAAQRAEQRARRSGAAHHGVFDIGRSATGGAGEGGEIGGEVGVKARRREAPPSGLPAISPTWGEIGCHLLISPNRLPRKEALSADLPISPLVGEMSGRTEGALSRRRIKSHRRAPPR